MAIQWFYQPLLSLVYFSGDIIGEMELKVGIGKKDRVRGSIERMCCWQRRP